MAELNPEQVRDEFRNELVGIVEWMRDTSEDDRSEAYNDFCEGLDRFLASWVARGEALAAAQRKIDRLRTDIELCRDLHERERNTMADLNPEQVRYWRTFPYGPQVPRADFRALADSWLAQREALAAAQWEIRKRDIELASWALTYNETRESQLEAALRLLELDPGNDRAMSWLRMMAGEHFEWEPARAALASLSSPTTEEEVFACACVGMLPGHEECPCAERARAAGHPWPSSPTEDTE